jgi:hypothetical protein
MSWTRVKPVQPLTRPRSLLSCARSQAVADRGHRCRSTAPATRGQHDAADDHGRRIDGRHGDESTAAMSGAIEEPASRKSTVETAVTRVAINISSCMSAHHG